MGPVITVVFAIIGERPILHYPAYDARPPLTPKACAGGCRPILPFCYNASPGEESFMRIFEKLQPLSLLALRLALGVIFFYHGY